MTTSDTTDRDPVVGASTALRVSTADRDGELLAAVRDEARDVPVAAVGPIGTAMAEPLLLATDDGTTRFYAAPSFDRAKEVARAVASGWTPPDGDAKADHDPATPMLPTPTTGPLSVGRRAVLGRAGWVAPTSLADYEASGGLAAAEVAGEPEAALDRIAGVVGRGWGDAAADSPVADQWRIASQTEGEPAVVVNAHGAPTDRLLLAATPLAVLEGALVAARATGAAEVIVFVSEADQALQERAYAAAEAFDRVASDVPIDVVAGPAEYKAAEPTMALEAIEGNHRLEARRRPPGPASYGLHGRPTLVHTPRTLVHVERAAAGASADTRVVTVTGDVSGPATVELTEGTPLATCLDAVEVEGALKAACVGGRFGGVTADLDVPCSPAALAEAGLGTGGRVEVLTDGTCLVAFAGERAAFAEGENCGRCVPCREGSTQLAGLLRAVYEREYEPDRIAELTRVMGTTSLCDFGVAAARPARSAIAAFDEEFRAHAEGRCPAGTCDISARRGVSA